MRVVFLSGPGGAGKTTVGKATQRLLADDWLFFESDRCHPYLPGSPGFATVENDRRIVRATLASVYAYVAEGFPMLVELDVADAWRRSACEARFSDVPMLFVVLTARREVALKRVQERGTDPTWFKWFETNHDRSPWGELPGTVTIDTSSMRPEEVATEIVNLIESDA